MDTITNDINEAMRLDGNAVAGELQMLLGVEVMALKIECGHCHWEGFFARLLAYVRGPGLVLRCPDCNELVMQLVHTPSGIILNVEGIAPSLKSTVFHR